MMQGFYFRSRRLFRLLFAPVAPVDSANEYPLHATSENEDCLAIEQGENEGMPVRAG